MNIEKGTKPYKCACTPITVSLKLDFRYNIGARLFVCVRLGLGE